MYEQLMAELAGYAGSEGLIPSDLLGLSDGLRHLMTWLTRRGGASLAELAAQAGCDEPSVATLADAMIAGGLIALDGEGIYRARMAGRRARPGSERLRKLFED